MTPVIYYVLAFLVIVIAYLIHRLLLTGRELYSLAGQKVLTCPETHEPVAVKVSLRRACAAALAGKEHIELSKCTRWPERQGCDQACLSELKTDPEEHGAWAIAAHWYEGKSCFYCGRLITHLSHLDHPPGLVSFEGKIIEWDKIPAEKLPAEFATAHPVCWNCSVVESFRQQHPELIIVRPWKH